MRGTHDFTVCRASGRGSSGQLASVGRAHAFRVCLFFFFFLNYSTNWWPYYARDCFPWFSFSSGSRSFLSPSSPSITLPQLTLLPAPSLPPPQPGYPGLASLLRRRAPLRRGLGGARLQAGPRSRTVAPSSSPELGRIQSVGVKPGEREESLQDPLCAPSLRRAGAERDSAVRECVLRPCE